MPTRSSVPVEGPHAPDRSTTRARNTATPANGAVAARATLTLTRPPVSVALAATLLFAVFGVFLARLVMRSRKWRPSTGTEDLVGMQGVVLAAIPGIAAGTGNEGMIRVRGELWRATAPQTIPAGQGVCGGRGEGVTPHVEGAEG